MDISSKSHLEIIKENKALAERLSGKTFKVSVLSNLTFNKLKDILEYPLRINNINAVIEFGNYDNVIQDSHNFSKSDTVIIHQELQNISGKLSTCHLINDQETNQEMIGNICEQIDLILNNLKDTKLVIYNTFSERNFVNNLHVQCGTSSIARSLNDYLKLKTKEYPNLRICDVDRIISKLGTDNCVDLRTYSAFKDLYKVNWLQEYVNEIQHYIYSLNGRIKKALILDCDNTLWKGVLGEDGFDGIKMSSSDKHGEPFSYVQRVVSQMSARGILICLCSKNNYDDVEQVLLNHNEITLKNNEITVKKVNWQNKAANIKEISDELNIGLDSFVFIDDSDFEVNLVKEQLPEVTVFQVPKDLNQYPAMIDKVSNYFYRNKITESDINKVKEYKLQAKRNLKKSEFTNIDDYIKSLEIEITIYKDSESHLARLEQMAQKTNQFNFTTIRHSESDIKSFFIDKNHGVYCIGVKDKFGDSGVTGMIITENISNTTCVIKTFLMSCRVIGRNIEYAFLKYVLEDVVKKGVSEIKASYIRTNKNQQIESFYGDLGFNLVDGKSTDSEKNYVQEIKKIKFKNTDYIGVTDG